MGQLLLRIENSRNRVSIINYLFLYIILLRIKITYNTSVIDISLFDHKLGQFEHFIKILMDTYFSLDLEKML